MNRILNKKSDTSNNSSDYFKFTPVQILTFGAVFMALRVVLGFLEINIGDSYRISFALIPVTLASYMLGPVTGGIIGACGDLITLLFNSTGAINFGILFAKTLWGVIMGLFLYRKKITVTRAIISNAAAIFICNIIITTISLCIAYGYPLNVIIVARIITNLIIFVPYVAATYYFAQLAEKIYGSMNKQYKKHE